MFVCVCFQGEGTAELGMGGQSTWGVEGDWGSGEEGELRSGEESEEGEASTKGEIRCSIFKIEMQGA